MNSDYSEWILCVIFAGPSIAALAWALKSRQFKAGDDVSYVVFEEDDDPRGGWEPRAALPRRRRLMAVALVAVFGCILLSPMLTALLARQAQARTASGQPAAKCPFQ